MLKYTFSFLLCLCVYPTWAVEGQITEPGTIDLDRQSAQTPVQLADGQAVTNHTILGPDQDLLPPFVALQTLAGQDYFEWCLRWNKLQYALAEQRAVPPTTIRGGRTSNQGYSEGYSGGYGFWTRPVRVRGSYYSTSRSHEDIWQIGGHAGGAVMLYNPFVTR